MIIKHTCSMLKKSASHADTTKVEKCGHVSAYKVPGPDHQGGTVRRMREYVVIVRCMIAGTLCLCFGLCVFVYWSV